MRCLVSGRVQGVFYRAATAEKAARLELSGWAKNLADGRVEVVACGDPAALDALCEWLWEGPPAAAVEGVRIEHGATEPPAGFHVR